MEKNMAQNMTQNQIWLKQNTTHIDECFEDFLENIKASEMTKDASHIAL